MAYSTYQDLVNSVEGYLKETGLQSQIGDFVILFESIEAIKLRHPLGQVVADYEVSTNYQTLPADCASVRSFGIKGRLPMTQVPYEAINDGRKSTYSVLGSVDGQKLVLPANSPDEPYTAEIVYIQKIGGLASATNWLYENFPMLYVYGTLLQAEPYLEKDERIATWNAMYQGSLRAMETGAASIEHGARQRSSTRVRSRI